MCKTAVLRGLATPVVHDARAGLRINAKCQVQDMNGQVIPGLYCGGESAGGFSQHGLARAICQGYIAGRLPRTKREYSHEETDSSRVLIGFAFWQAWCLGMSGSLAAPASKEACLNCHGPFDKLTTSTSGYASPSGEEDHPAQIRTA